MEDDEPKVTQEDVGTRILIAKHGQRILVDDDYDGEYFATFSWNVNPKTGFVQAHDRRIGKSRPSIYLHHLVAGPILPSMEPGLKKGQLVRTHVNGDKLDNRTTNIKWMTKSERNLARHQARRAPRPQTSRFSTPYRGVNRDARPHSAEGYIVSISQQYVGYYDLEEAARAYDDAAYARWGRKAVLNFPAEYDVID